jgi:hypothetical protein
MDTILYTLSIVVATIISIVITIAPIAIPFYVGYILLKKAKEKNN